MVKRGRGIWVLAAALAVSLALAYWAAQREVPRHTGSDLSFALWTLDAEDVSRIDIHLAKAEFTIEPEEGGPGAATPYLWVKARLPEKPAAPAVPPNSDPSKAKPPKAEPPKALPAEGEEDDSGALAFKGNKSAEQAYASLAKFIVQRRLGPLSEVQGEAFGLTPESVQAGQESITIERKDGAPALRIQLGASTFGDASRYVHFSGDDSVYLVKQSILQGLTRAPARMMDRDLFPFPVPEAQRIELRTGDKAVSFWRLPDAAGEETEWGDAPDAETGDEAVQKFVKELARLKSARFAHEPAASPGVGQAAPLEIRIAAEGKPDAWLRFLEERQGGWIARSSHTRRDVRLTGKSAQPLLDAAQAIMQAR